MMNKTTVQVLIIVTLAGFIGTLFYGSTNYDLTSLKTSLSIGGVNSDVRDERHFRMHENDTLDQNADQMDFKSWEIMASEHWKTFHKPENLLDVFCRDQALHHKCATLFILLRDFNLGLNDLAKLEKILNNKDLTQLVSTPTQRIGAIFDLLITNDTNLHIQNYPVISLPYRFLCMRLHTISKQKQPDYDKRFKNPCWYGAKMRLNCLPYFFLTGIKKSGTSSLFHAIRQHPDIVSKTSKETQWFPRRRFDSPGMASFQSFIKLFASSALVIEKQLKNEPKKFNSKIIGEGTPANLHLNTHWRYLPENAGLSEPKYVIHDYIRHLIPQAKIIAIFRDPTERLYSEYYHEYQRQLKWKNTSNIHFHEVVTKGLQLYKDCFKHFTRRSCVYNETIYQYTRMNIQLGIYHVFWEDLLRIYPRDQLLIVHKLDMETNLGNTLQRIYTFLGLHTLSQSMLKSIANETDKFAERRYSRNGSRQQILPETHEILKEFYQPFNEIMADITNDRRFVYQSN